MSNEAQAILASTLLGIPITWAWSTALFWILNRQVPEQESTGRLLWIPILIGVAERGIVTALMIWAPDALVPFIGGWIALKVAGGWGLLQKPTTRNRAVYFLGLLGNVVSIGWAIGCALYYFPSAINNFSSAA